MNKINTNFDELIREGIINSEDVINKDKINLISGTIAAPLIETIWAFSGNNIEAIRKILETLTQQYSTGRENEMLDILQILYYIVGMEIPKNINFLKNHIKARQYFLFSLLLDIDDCMQDLIMDQTED